MSDPVWSAPAIPPSATIFGTMVVRLAIQWAGVALVTRGFISSDDLAGVAGPAAEVLFGGLVLAFGFALSCYARTKARLVGLVARLEDVRTVHVSPELAAKVAAAGVVATPLPGR